MKEKDEVLNGILQSADRHPNSRVAKLIRIVESERTQKNIVMLLIELAENVEYATDFGISIKYYLDLFERLGLGRDIMLNETGLLLLNSSKIYSRRVDFVHELIERQILTLSNADREIAEAKNAPESSAPIEKPKRGRKRLLEAPKEAYEVTLAPKKFRKISHEKRFAVNSTNAATIRANQVKLKAQMRHTETEQSIHPAGWVHSSIVDLENDEEIDSKRNYKLFTYHVEHRYNTLVPDINFRLHFMVKDFIDEEEEQLQEEFKESAHYPPERTTTWPPLSEAYVEQYLQLENRLLKCGEQPRRKKANTPIRPQAEANNPQHQAQESVSNEILNSTVNTINLDSNSTTVTSEALVKNISDCNVSSDLNDTIVESNVQNDSGLGESISETNDKTVTEEVKDEKKDSNISSCELTAEDANSLKIKDAKAGIDDENKNEKEANSAEMPKLETAQNNNTNDEKETISTSILDTSTNILDDAFNSTPINSSAISLTESISATTNTNNITITTDTSLNFANESLRNDSALGSSIFDSNNSSLTEELDSSSATSLTLTQTETTILDKEQNDLNAFSTKEVTGSLPLDEDLLQNDADQNIDKIDGEKLESRINLPTRKRGLHDDTQINLDEIRIHLPHLDDEGVFFSDLDEQDQRMLSPTVMALDVFPSLHNKKNFTIIVDDDIRAMLNITEDEPETYVMPVEKPSDIPAPITLNIMELPEKMLRRRVLFKLGAEYDLFLQARMRKRKRADESPRECRMPKQIKWYHLNDTDMTGVHVSPVNSPGHSSAEFNGFSDDDDCLSDFYGFPENDQSTPNTDDINHHRLSRDSGVDGVDGPITNDKTSLNTIVEEAENVIENSKTEINITETTSASTNDNTVKNNFENNTEKNNSENVAINSAPKEIIPPAEVVEEKIELLPQDEEKDTANVESATNITNVLDIETNLSADNFDSGSVLDSTDTVIFSVEEITEAQNIDDLLDNADNNLAAYNDIEQVVSGKETRIVTQFENELDNTLDDIELNSSKTKIQKWHEHLQPILSKSRERHHFDVFQIGTEIMNELEEDRQTSEESANVSPKCTTFQNVMENKDASYVSRYFLSSLLLANQSNIKITVSNKSSEEPTAWKDIQFDLLSTKRHTVSIEDNIGMVQKAGVSKMTKAKTALPQHKRVATNCSTKYNRITDADRPASSSSCSYSTQQATPEETQTCELVNVNLDVVKPLKHLEKLPRNGDDYDSGIFSSEELM